MNKNADFGVLEEILNYQTKDMNLGIKEYTRIIVTRPTNVDV
jgi:hypothetical protein